MSNPTENIQEANQPLVQEEHKPLFGGTDSQGKERLFNTVEEAQQSWQHSQDFIKTTVQEKQTLEAKVQELEAKVNQSLKLEEALEKFKQQDTTQMTQQPNQKPTTESTSQLDLEQLTAQLTENIMGKLSASQQETVYNKNELESIEAAKSVFGNDFESKLRGKAQSFNMSDDDITNMARTNPTMFKKIFELDKQTATVVTTPTGGNAPPHNNVTPVAQKPAFFAKDATAQMVDRLNAKAKERGINQKLF